MYTEYIMPYTCNYMYVLCIWSRLLKVNIGKVT